MPPPDRPAPWPGRYDLSNPPPSSILDEAVFGFNPAARLWFSWEASQPLTVIARLLTYEPDEIIDSAVIDHVWDGIQKVRPAGVRVLLAVNQAIVRGDQDGTTA